MRKSGDTIFICSPHQRNEHLWSELSIALPSHRVVLVKNQESLSKTLELNSVVEWIFFPHWSERIPEDVWKAYKCVAFHMTDLPFGRGGSPLQNLIQAGFNETVLSAFRVNGEWDAGPVYAKRPLSLAGSAEEILKRASKLIKGLIVDIVHSDLFPVDQVGTTTYFTRRTPEQSEIKEIMSKGTLYDFIRMLDADGYPRAFIRIGQSVLRFKDATFEDGSLSATLYLDS